MRSGIGAWLLLGGFCFAVSYCVAACEPPKNAKEAAAEGAYGLALQRCVDKSSTEEEADECAADVRRRWSKDGGR